MSSLRRTALVGLLMLLGTGWADDELMGPPIPVLPCRTADFASEFVVGYGGHESDIPRAITCVLEMGGTTPSRLLTFSNLVMRPTDDHESWRDRWQWDVTVAGRDVPATIQPLPAAEFPSMGGCGLEIGDFNFDSFTDIGLPRDFQQGLLDGPTACRRTFLLFDPELGRFVQNDVLSRLIDPSFDAATHAISTRTDEGRAGALYTAETYRFERGEPVLQRRERRLWADAAKGIRETIEERRAEDLRLISDRVIGDGTADLYDPTVWQLMDARPVDLGPRLRGVTVVVLRSTPDPTRDDDSQTYLVDVILADGGRVLYRFSHDEVHPPKGTTEAEALHVEHGFIDAHVGLDDVTNDGVPDVLFETGEFTGFNEIVLRHVIHCDDATKRCWDARNPDFITCRREDFRWLRSKRGKVAVRATPVCDETCDYRYCAAPFRFDMYSWDAGKKRFALTRSFTTKERLTEDGIDANMRYVDRLLR